MGPLRRRFAAAGLLGSLKETDHLEALGVDGGIFRLNFNEQKLEAVD